MSNLDKMIEELKQSRQKHHQMLHERISECEELSKKAEADLTELNASFDKFAKLWR